MCTADSERASGHALLGDASGTPAGIGNAADALQLAGAALDYLNSVSAADLDGSAYGEMLTALGEIQAKLTAAHAAFLRRFDAASAHDDDGYGSSAQADPAQPRAPGTARLGCPGPGHGPRDHANPGA